MQLYQSDIFFICPVCGEEANTTLQLPEPTWSSVNRLSDIYTHDDTEVTCPKCLTDFSALSVATAYECQVTLEGYPKTKVHAGVPGLSEPDDWYDYALPERPIEIFLDSYAQTWEILEKHGSENGGDLINRMIFAQQITAFEAYLGDTLLKSVLADKEVQARLISKDQDLSQQKFSLPQILSSPRLVEDNIRKHLNGIVYHNLGKVENLYKNALEIELWTNQDIRQKLHKVISYRHDCVHRNGFDKDGNRLDVFTKKYIQETANIMKIEVKKIESLLLKDLEF